MNMLAEPIKPLKLTKKQKVIAEYFIQNQERLGSLTSMEAANEIGVSDASVIRFSRMIGFAGYGVTGPLSNFEDIVLLVDISGVSFFHSAVGADIVAEYILSLVSGKAELQERIEERTQAAREQRVA